MISAAQYRATETEDEFVDWIIEYAHTCGWLACHFRPARTNKGWRTPIKGDKGCTDLILARDGDVRLAEVKSATGRYGDGQLEWGRELGEFYRYWRPKDKPLIMEDLK